MTDGKSDSMPKHPRPRARLLSRELAKLGLFTHSRLSVSNVGDEEWNFLLQLENQTTDIGTTMDAKIAVELARKGAAKVSVKDKGVNKKAERDAAKRKVSQDDAGNGTAVKKAKK